MGYLQPTEYEAYGLSPDTTDDWITMASALIETYCRRPSLNVTQYTERFRLRDGQREMQLSYLPLSALLGASSPLISAQGRFRTPGSHREEPLAAVWPVFAQAGTWMPVDPTTLSWTQDGNLELPYSPLQAPFAEMQVTYMAGLATTPDAVKIACAAIVKNGQSTAGTNIRSSRADLVQMQYFSDQLVDSTARMLLRPWVANRLG